MILNEIRSGVSKSKQVLRKFHLFSVRFLANSYHIWTYNIKLTLGHINYMHISQLHSTRTLNRIMSYTCKKSNVSFVWYACNWLKLTNLACYLATTFCWYRKRRSNEGSVSSLTTSSRFAPNAGYIHGYDVNMADHFA